MFEKVNPCHPDKVADIIAGALVDLAYKKAENPRIAVEVLIGHGVCHIIAEASVSIPIEEITATVYRIAGNLTIDYVEVPQNSHLADNQADGVRCGDNGIFKGMPVTEEQKMLSQIARNIFSVYPFDGNTFWTVTGSSSARAMQRHSICVRFIPMRRSIRWAIGQAAPMWTPA